MDDAWRSAANYAPSSGPFRCDSTLAQGWYRIKLNGADKTLPTSAPSIFACATAAPLWFQGNTNIFQNKK